MLIAAVTESADVADSKSAERKLMGVQLSPAAPKIFLNLFDLTLRVSCSMTVKDQAMVA